MKKKIKETDPQTAGAATGTAATAASAVGSIQIATEHQ